MREVDESLGAGRAEGGPGRAMGRSRQRRRGVRRAVISLDALNAWRSGHPWVDDDQVEQDLIMTRVAIEIASHPELRDRLAWRGGTCLHKLFVPMALRYSEDLDDVAYDLSVEDNDMRTLRTGLREVAERVGLEVSSSPKTTRSRLVERLAKHLATVLGPGWPALSITACHERTFAGVSFASSRSPSTGRMWRRSSPSYSLAVRGRRFGRWSSHVVAWARSVTWAAMGLTHIPRTMSARTVDG